jgi:hypothetical protein
VNVALRFFLAFTACVVTASAVRAQQQLSIEIVLPAEHAPTASDGPAIVASNVLSDSATRNELHHGFPTKLHYKVELWRKGLTDSRESVKEWDVGVLYEPASQIYDVSQRVGDRVTNLGHTSSMTEVEVLLDKAHALLLGPKEPGQRYYYVAQLDVTTVTGNDLAGTLLWLNGQFKPAVSGNENILTRAKNGVLSFFGFMLGKKLSAYRSSAIFTAG